jgi:pimeloyl-ACP methyl ester carboxylesterase
MSQGQRAVPSHQGAVEVIAGSDDLFVLERGPTSAPPIILVHGAPDRSGVFRQVLAHLQDHHVIVYDRRGYGRSVRLPTARTMVEHAEDLLRLAGRCSAPPAVIAHSFGSNPTMLAASLRPAAFRVLGLWEPPMPWVDWWSETTKAYNAAVAASSDPGREIEEMYRRLLGDETWEALPAERRAQRRAEGPAFQADMASELDTPFDFSDVTTPAVVGYGTETSEEHNYGARWLADMLPNARSEKFIGTAHFAPTTHPETFATFVLSVTGGRALPHG